MTATTPANDAVDTAGTTASIGVLATATSDTAQHAPREFSQEIAAPRETEPEFTPARQELAAEAAPRLGEFGTAAEVAPSPQEFVPEVAPRAHELAPEVAPASQETTSVAEPAPAEFVNEVPQTSAPIAFTPVAAPEPAPPPLKLEWPSDLVQIETDPAKAQAAASQQAQEQPAFRPRRVRPAPVPLSDGPLVQVETRKRDMSGPYEAPHVAAHESASTAGHS